MIDISDPDNWDVPIFTVAVAAEACGIAPGNLRVWFQRKQIALDAKDIVPDKEGLPRLLTLRTVLTIAATAALVRQRVRVEHAYEAAKKWTQRGDFRRNAADLFPAPNLTMLAFYSPNHSKILEAAVSEGKLIFEHGDWFPPGYEASTYALAVVPLNKVDQLARETCKQFLRYGGKRS